MPRPADDREIIIVDPVHKRNNRRDRGKLVPQLLCWGPTMYWFPQLLGRSFQKAIEISQQVVTRMQDLASEF